MASFESFSEKGSDQDVTYDNRTSQAFEGVLQAEVSRQGHLDNGRMSRIAFTGALVDTFNLGSSDMTASFAGTDFTVSILNDRNVVGGRVGLVGQMQLTKTAFIFASTRLGIYSDDSRSWDANMGVKIKF